MRQFRPLRVMRFDMRSFAVAAALVGTAVTAPSSAAAADVAACRDIPDDTARLRCYDRLANRAAPPTGESAASDRPAMQAIAAASDGTIRGTGLTPLDRHWEIGPEAKRGTFEFRAHRSTYLLPIRVSNPVGETPTSPAPGRTVAGPLDWNRNEVKFQLSFKVKVLEDLFDRRADLWFGYTQQSNWQLYNNKRSAPFRETNYEPEAMLVFRTDYDVFGLKARFVNLGLVHQSNGQSNPFSRSWNRLYAQAGFERGNFALLVRPWIRIPEGGGNDDNPDIREFVGRGDVVALYKTDSQHVHSLLLRNNLQVSGNKGAVQYDWAFPLYRPADGKVRFRGHLQVFSGYGESLIDYNFRQTTIGFGISLSEPL
jgi:phospholipase A1